MELGNRLSQVGADIEDQWTPNASQEASHVQEGIATRILGIAANDVVAQSPQQPSGSEPDRWHRIYSLLDWRLTVSPAAASGLRLRIKNQPSPINNDSLINDQRSAIPASPPLDAGPAYCY